MRTHLARLRSLARELRQRHVYRAAALYAAGVFVLLQAADLVIEGLGLPAWVLTLLIILAVLGLPVVVVLSWAFDLTPPGVHRSGRVPASAPAAGRADDAGRSVGWGRALVSGAVLVLVGAMGFGAYVRVRGAPAAALPSIAVLPFADLGGDPVDEYLRDGLTEDVLTQLAQASGLRVISRTSVMQYKGSVKGVRTLAAELGVSHVLEGSVRREGDRLRITAQLIDARTDQHLWAETYDRTSSDVFAVQSDIARRIAAALRVRLSPEERDRLEAVPAGDPAAYDLYLRARQYLYRYEREANEVAIELARKALALDPELSAAHALLGTAFSFKVRQGDGPEWADSGMAAARRAIALDHRLADGHLALGNAYLRQGRYPEALQSYRRAAALNPSDWRAAANSAAVYAYQGKPVESLRWTRRAMAMDPLSPLMGVAYRNLARYYLDLSLPDEAEEALRRAAATGPADHPHLRTLGIEIALRQDDYARARALADSLAADAPTDPAALLSAGDAYLFAGEPAGALPLYQRAYALSPEAEGVRHYAPTLLGYVLWRQGETERAERLFAEVDALARDELAKGHDNYTVFLTRAAVAVIRGDRSSAFDDLASAAASGAVAIEWTLAHDPLLDGIRDDVRFRALRAELRTWGDAMRRQVRSEGLGVPAPR